MTVIYLEVVVILKSQTQMPIRHVKHMKYPKYLKF